METAPLKSFATWARRELITQVSARLTAVLAPASPARVENQRAITMLERDIAAAGGGAKGKDAIAEKVAYTWFNRIIALRFMDANGYTGVGVVSPAHGQQTGQPEILADAKRGNIDPAVVSNKRTLDTIIGLLDGTRPSADAQGEAYTILLAEYCRYWNRSMPFMFEREGDYTELLIPANLLASDSILTRATAALTADACRDVEVIGWLYQFYISERKDEVFAGFKRGKKAGAEEIPAATQLFTPHWIVRYLVENSLGRLWMLNHPSSRLVEQMDYYIAPVNEEADFLKVSGPEELKVIDPACGSGHMLTYAFDLLHAIYEEEGYAPSEIPELILTHNLYGTEIDPRAGSLAAFALTMKARAMQRSFFNNPVAPNTCAIDPISFTPHEVDFLVTRYGDRREEEDFWNQFAEADTLGALIQPDPNVTDRLLRHLETLDDSGDMLKADTIKWAARVIEQATVLSRRYHVAVANPPYMGQRNASDALQSFLKSRYPSTKSDLYSAFIERMLELVAPGGYLAMITMQSWMSLTTYAGLRAKILADSELVTLAHLGTGAFDSIGGEVVSTVAFVLEPGASAKVATFVRLTDLRSEALKAAALRDSVHGDVKDRRYLVEADTFAAIPGSPFAYWLPEAARRAFVDLPSLGDIASPRVGMQTSNNGKFLRSWWEVSATEATAPLSGSSKWITYLKGGAFRRWYGNVELLLHYNGDPGHILSQRNATILSLERGMAPKVTWTDLTSGDFSARLAPQGSFHDISGHCFYPNARDAEWVLGFSNSRVFQMYLSVLNSTMHAQVGDVARIPVTEFDRSAMAHLAARAVELSRRDFDRSETSSRFQASELVSVTDPAQPLRRIYESLVTQWRAEIDELHDIEVAVDSLADPDGVSDWFRQADYPRTVSLGINPAYSFLRASDAEAAKAQRSAAVAELVSYGVGCMFGRYSLDVPGLILADQGATVQDYLAKVPVPTLAPDADNVLPLVDGDWFEDDIVARFRQFLRAAFGEQHFEENLRFVEGSLGVTSLREYFITRAGRSKFYDDHVKRYKKRPIYWLFSSPKGSFNALIYMHRYTSSTVSTVLNEYLREFESKLEANLQHQDRLAAGDGTPREKAAALKEAERLRKVLLELGEYEHDVLYPLASQQIAIDFDDGVRANYPKFYPALKKIAGLEAADE
ncbi:BREX-1 system adenine-specific DNA-methyltransferase PglX [Agrococcus sp. ARC_14]|uniref:BREX-1 system adenine-specific DNA-methyltransferase PglX n=1 Tax=Agrococcus sp. ARC_14 TaxID=2919927 RepID=UPI001F067F2E|nr:BREX-1 system adenine-specific DNA-methyltransferase PglX [Agrococcus sp. ARC_14]MCH1882877.1 BREX-1 system adenine-specific DNA-methyltransferase PglX [Agrococcus sp. ARC_14]